MISFEGLGLERGTASRSKDAADFLAVPEKTVKIKGIYIDASSKSVLRCTKWSQREGMEERKK